MLRPALDMPGIYLYRDPVDFRKSFRGLAAIVEQELRHNPFEGGFYAFTNRRRNKIKCLYSATAPASLQSWEGNGFVLYYKSLAEEKFRWPRRGGRRDFADRTTDQLAAGWLRYQPDERP